MIVVNHTGHSGFTVESETHMLIFDYSEGMLPALPMKKKLYVFVSHVHEDHFNPEILDVCKEHPNVRFILSHDIPRSMITDHGVTDYIVAEPGMDIRPESRFRIKALTAHRNAKLLFEQVREFRPEMAGLTVPVKMEEIPEDLRFCQWVMGKEALKVAASQVEVDQVLVSVVGIAGLWCISLLFRDREPVTED